MLIRSALGSDAEGGGGGGGGPTTYTDWRIYITANQTVQQSRIAEIEMRATVGGADQCSGGYGFADTETGNAAGYAFDNSTAAGNRWESTNTPLPHYIGYHFATPVDVKQFTIHNNLSGYSPVAFSLQAFNGSGWVTKGTYTDGWGSHSEMHTYSVP